MIKVKHPVRNDFSSCSTGEYYKSKGAAINAFDTALHKHDMHLDENDSDFNGDEGHKLMDIYQQDEVIGYASLYWYQMPSGNYEFIGYIA